MSSDAKLTGKLRYHDYVLFPQNGQRHEIIDGEHLVNPAPSTYHQILSGRIHFQLFSQIEVNRLGQVFSAPTDVQLTEFDIVQPDLMIVLNRNRTIITPTKIKGPPDLIVEILSASSADNDRGLKKELYRRSAVPEYWIVDPNEHFVEQFTLEAAAYVSVGQHTDGVVARVAKGIRVNLTEVW